MNKKILIIIGVIVIIGVILGVSINRSKDENTFILGMDDSFPPMGYRNENNELVGFDIDLANEVCKKMGMELKTQTISWAAKEQELDSGNIDCIWNGFGYTEDRNNAMTLSKPYVKDKSMFVVKEDSSYEDQDELKGKKIGVQSGSTQEKRLNESNYGKELGEIIGYTDYLTALMDLETGNIDAVYMSQISGNYIIEKQNKEFKTFDAIGIGEESKGMVIAFKKGNVELKDKVEKALDELSNKAIQQIKDNKYDYGLKGKVIYIGLAHHGKDVSIKWVES